MTSGMNYVLYTNNTSKQLLYKEQHLWDGNASVRTGPFRLAPGSSDQGRQMPDHLHGPLKFGIVYVDREEQVPSTRKFITAFDIIPRRSFGPFGSALAPTFSMRLAEGESIKEVIVRHGFIIDAFGFVVADKTGATISTQIFGGDGGKEERITLEPGEIVQHISGRHGIYAHSDGRSIVGILRIFTNLKQYNFGSGELVVGGGDYSSGLPGPIIGFFGRHSNYLESIGGFIGTTVLPNKVYAESGPASEPTDWSEINKKLVESAPSVVHVNDALGIKIEATVADNGDGTIVYSETEVGK